MLRQVELRMGFQMTVETRRRIFPRIHDEPPASAARLDVFAAGTVTGFAAAHSSHGRAFNCRRQSQHRVVQTGTRNQRDGSENNTGRGEKQSQVAKTAHRHLNPVGLEKHTASMAIQGLSFNSFAGDRVFSTFPKLVCGNIF